MKNLLDGEVIEISCPHCGNKLKERIGKLKANPTLTCARCRGTVAIKADQMRGEIAKVEKALADLQRTLGRIGK